MSISRTRPYEATPGHGNASFPKNVDPNVAGMCGPGSRGQNFEDCGNREITGDLAKSCAGSLSCPEVTDIDDATVTVGLTCNRDRTTSPHGRSPMAAQGLNRRQRGPQAPTASNEASPSMLDWMGRPSSPMDFFRPHRQNSTGTQPESFRSPKSSQITMAIGATARISLVAVVLICVLVAASW
ncbi:hypothetical protein C8R44DRAFT_885238 [Mycena epipterygia]|nr:hypothetical protein C8R44DRAFT_885238 [Mycena epipterygia]